MKHRALNVFVWLALGMASLVSSTAANALIRLNPAIGLCADAEGGEIKSGVRLILWHCHNRGNQQIYLDWYTRQQWEAQPPSGTRDATLRFTDGKHCVNAEDLTVQPNGRCGRVLAYHFRDNVHIIRMSDSCLYSDYKVLATIGGKSSIIHVEAGQKLVWKQCHPDGNVLEAEYAAWRVEQF